MSADSIIAVEGLSKRYVIGRRRSEFVGMRHVVENAVRAPLRWMRGKSEQSVTTEDFWALRDISFEVKRGEVIGVIGRNGAGKSTLLKVLSRITEPTAGRIVIGGRIASLLEVGTGFHPDLTGRENIFLNGAILGMGRIEIKRKFDEIVAFAEVEQFLDTPVKRYSSGMYVRLAFAVAAHLEPEILIVDEVLAVGDAQFQQKCLGKMQDVAAGGRTVLFVSHNMNAVARLCGKCIVLSKGTLMFYGDVADAFAHYGAAAEATGQITLADERPDRILRSVDISQHGVASSGVLQPLGTVYLDFSLKAPSLLKRPRVSLAFSSSKGERIFAVGSWLGPSELPPFEGTKSVRITFTLPPIMPGKYSMDVAFYDLDSEVSEEYYSAGTIEVAETNYLQMLEPTTAEIGQIHVRSECSIVQA